MKAIKISLAVVVVAVIIGAIIRGIIDIEKVNPSIKAENPFIERIQQEIEELKDKPETSFSKDFYNQIKYHIDDYHKNNRLGDTESQNNQIKNDLSSDLYAAYTEKFIKQAKAVFNGSEWEQSKLNFIRTEYQELQRDSQLERGGPVDKEFDKIKMILAKYDEINNFISSCRGFSYAGNNLSDRFPISKVKDEITLSKTYLHNNLENEYVKNCERLREGLKNVPEMMFRSHVKYVDNKINYWSGMYSYYNTQRAYKENLYDKLRDELDELNNNLYSEFNIDNEYRRLLGKLNSDSNSAYNYFNQN